MNCLKFRTEIEELERGATPTEPARAHAAGCDSCRDLRAGGESLRALVGSLARVEAPGDFEFRLRARIARSEGARARPATRRGFVPGAAWLAAAGCLVLALGLFVNFRPGQGVSPRPAPTGGQIAASGGVATADAPRPLVNTPVDEAQAGSGGEKTYAAASGGNRRALAPRRQKFVLPREAVRELAGAQPTEAEIGTNVLESQGMKIYVGSPIALPMSTQERPLEALFKDTSGATRSVSVDAVTFGARGLPGRRVPVRNASYTQGVW